MSTCEYCDKVGSRLTKRNRLLTLHWSCLRCYLFEGKEYWDRDYDPTKFYLCDKCNWDENKTSNRFHRIHEKCIKQFNKVTESYK